LWLKSISANMADSGSRQFFYRSGAWGYKKLLTSSASWAELKHDTILYGEQSGAEMGDGGWYAGKFAPPFPRGYVEPDPQTFGVLGQMASRLLDFIRRFGYGDEDDYYGYPRKLKTFLDLCATAEDIARREAEGERIGPEDYGNIKSMTREWNAALLMPDGMELLDPDDPLANTMALIADVATDFFAGRALYAATGAPRELLVYVNDKSGGSRIARGWVYSYYEFARPLAEGRMNDAEWKKMVYDPGLDLRPLHPEWYSEIFPGWE
ncbi:MAG: DUF3160 domain-containing protein, partial [Synergistaceae bacterium]|nr:DUF3160 domain-containing protein [Synergistaceae bacterium]